jgi:hypothetical protein
MDADHHWKEAIKYFDLAKAASSLFMRAYYQRIDDDEPLAGSTKNSERATERVLASRSAHMA